MRRAGASKSVIDQVLEELYGYLYDGIPTRNIYKFAFKLLKRHNRPVAARYSLKQAIMELGPSGYPFEEFLAALLKSQGYSTQTGVILPGACINHEIDVVAKKGTESILVECKYHPVSGSISNVKIPLYIHSRFRDLQESLPAHPEFSGCTLHQWIVTNTRFSDDAMAYGRCANLFLLGWDYPSGNSLREMVDDAALYPLTCLTTLTMHEKKLLLETGKVLCRHLLDHPSLLDKISITSGRKATILKEVEQLCQNAVKV